MRDESIVSLLIRFVGNEHTNDNMISIRYLNLIWEREKKKNADIDIDFTKKEIATCDQIFNIVANIVIRVPQWN